MSLEDTYNSTNPVPIDPIQRVNFLRQKVIQGDTISDEELHEALTLLRMEQTDKVKTSTKKASKKKQNSDPLPDDLSDLFKK